MPKRISAELEAAILHEAQTTDTSQRKLSDQFGVSRGTIAAILTRLLGVKPTVRPEKVETIQRSEAIRYEETPSYYCEGCEAMVTYDPCPACIARDAQRNGVRSVLDGVSDKSEPTEATCDEPREEIPLCEVPESVSDWFNERLGAMIGESGHRDDVAEATQEFSAQMRRLIEVMANALGEDRRETRWKSWKHSHRQKHLRGVASMRS